jgi:hypothetical protein
MSNDLRIVALKALAKLEHLWEIGVDAEFNVELLPEINALRDALRQPWYKYVSDEQLLNEVKLRMLGHKT